MGPKSDKPPYYDGSGLQFVKGFTTNTNNQQVSISKPKAVTRSNIRYPYFPCYKL